MKGRAELTRKSIVSALGADVGAVGAERLAEGADDDVDLAAEPGGGDRAAAPGPTAPVACASSTISRAPWRRASSSSCGSGATSPSIEKTPSVTISAARPPARSQPPGEVLDVAVAVDEGLGAREAAAVDDAGVVQLVGEDDLAAAGQGGDRAGVGEVAGAEEERRLVALEAGEPLLQLPVRLHVARDQPRGAGAGPPAQRRLGGGLAHLGAIGEAEVVVRAEEEDRAAVERDARPLRSLDQSQLPVEPPLAELLEPLGDVAHAARG